MKERRKLFTGLMLLLFLLFGASCASSEPSETPIPTAAEPTATIPPTAVPTVVRPRQLGDIRVWTSWEEDKLEVLNEYLLAYQEMYPDITISLSYYPEDELLPAFQKSYQDGTAPTILIGPSEYGPQLMRQDMVLDITERLPESYQENLYPYLWSQVQYDEKIIGLPLEQKGYVLIRNRQLVPERAATVEELAAASFEASDGLVIGAALDLGFPFTSSQLPVCDAVLTDAYFQPAFNTEQGECWMEMLARLSRIGRTSFNDDEDLELFLEERSGWLIDGSWRIDQAVDVIGETWVAVDFWPVYDEAGKRLAGYVWTENAYLVSAHTVEDTELSWAFLAYFSSEDSQNEITGQLGTRQIPVLETVPLDDLLLRQTVFVLERGVPLPVQVNLDVYAEALEPEMLAVMEGDDPGLALQRAEDTMEELLQAP